MEQIKFKFNYLWQVLLIKLEPTGLEKPSLRKHPFLHALRRWGRFALLQSHFPSALSEFAALNPFKRVQIFKVKTIL